jgi:hypothetical protein
MFLEVLHQEGRRTFFVIDQRELAHKLITFDLHLKKFFCLKLFEDGDARKTADVIAVKKKKVLDGFGLFKFENDVQLFVDRSDLL